MLASESQVKRDRDRERVLGWRWAVFLGSQTNPEAHYFAPLEWQSY